MERRAHVRHRVHAGSAQIAAPPGFVSCSIKDIGRNGLAVDYQPTALASFQSDTIDIVSRGCNGLFIPNISCRTVYDVGQLMEGQSFTGRQFRTRGLQFVRLSDEQKDKLELLLKRCFGSSPYDPLGGTVDFG